jgi:hypothetical protein
MGEMSSTGAVATALLHALARDEANGRRPPRLIEPEQATWKRFRGRLSSGDLFRLLAEDASQSFPVPFRADRLGREVQFDNVDDEIVETFLARLPALDLKRDGAAYIEEQARLLGVPTKLAKSELHQVKVHQKVLELPGTGGQLSHHLVTTQKGITLQVNCVVACDGWAELALAGIVGLDLGVPDSSFIVSTTPDDLRNDQHPLRQQRFDFVVGMRPDRGGKLDLGEQLALWFHGAKVVLV